MNRICKTSFGLSSLIIDGELTFDSGINSDLVVLFYTEHFTAQDQDMYDDTIFGEFIQHVVDIVDNDMLTAMPSVEEIKSAVFDMEPSSSPGPDGFGGSFYQACWDIIAFDVIEAKPGANRMEDFRPIVIGNYLFKVFTKIITSRLGDIAAMIMTPYQFGFVLGKRITSLVGCETGITHGSLPLSYLGIPIFRGAPHTCHLAALADSIISKFSKWKGHSLYLAGRKCMINVVIAASLVHSLMVYYWPRTLLKKIENAMRNFLWTGDISRRNTSCSVSWARVCSPLDEGGLGVRSIHHTNDSFICKLAWDILCNKTSDISLLHDRYISAGGRPRSYGRPSSIWPGIRRHLDRLIDGSSWVMGQSSGISFWNDNWLGYIISKRIGILQFFVIGLTSTISDYFYDEHLHFDYDFFMKHTDIVRDILSIHASRGGDRRVWGHLVSGQLTSRMAYDLLRSSNPRVN
ncbi:hypothetical protein ACS0TY_010838 [Phlomoides rotata]